MAKAKPFVKCVGGKGQLIEQLEALLPADFAERENVTYIEPFCRWRSYALLYVADVSKYIDAV